MTASTPTVDCDECEVEMKFLGTWSSKSPPLIGKTIKYAEYKCRQCEGNTLLQRKKTDEKWQAV